MKGFTQNQNEALNGTVWNRCPKTRFCGQRRVQIAVCEAVCVFNCGAGAVFDLLSSVSMKPSTNAVKALHNENKRRLFEAARKISLKARLIRRKKRAEKKSKGHENKSITYLAGSFGIKSTPDFINVKVNKCKNTSIVKKTVVKPIFVSDGDVRGVIIDSF